MWIGRRGRQQLRDGSKRVGAAFKGGREVETEANTTSGTMSERETKFGSGTRRMVLISGYYRVEIAWREQIGLQHMWVKQARPGERRKEWASRKN